jgi:cyclophilin family peptidyl-prolyl cis-trans isomerase
MTISFARGGVNSRSNQIFINLKDNPRLDKLAYSGVTGFPVVAKVIAGQENVLKFYDGYGDKLGYKQDSITKFGNTYLREKYPKVDYIIKAYILK